MSPAGGVPTAISGRQGHYAGAASRLVAFLIDVGLIWGLFAGAVALISAAGQLVVGRSYHVDQHRVLSACLLAGWVLIYFAYQWALSGRTLGMAIFGVRVVRRDGSALNGRRALLRTVTFPLGFLTLGIGFLGVLTNPERQALYDRIADTTVVYAWDARAARLRWLARTDLPKPSPGPTSAPAPSRAGEGPG